VVGECALIIKSLTRPQKKDPFSLPFMDQMLDRLTGRSHYWFIDGYSVYTQVLIAPDDKEKTTFTCPFGTYAFRRMPFVLCNALKTFQRCLMNIFPNFITKIMKVFMDDFTVHGDFF